MKFSSLQVPGGREEYRDNTHPFKPWRDDAPAKEIVGRGVPASQRSGLHCRKWERKKREKKSDLGQVEIRRGPGQFGNRAAGRNPLHTLSVTATQYYSAGHAKSTKNFSDLFSFKMHNEQTFNFMNI